MNGMVPACLAPEVLDRKGGQDRTTGPQKIYWGKCVAGAQQGYNASAEFPKRFVNFTAFVAEHGSLSSPQRPGFRVAAVRVTNGAGTSTSHVNFASGWLLNGVPWGAFTRVSIGIGGVD